jgi:hypothetical protein
MRVCTTEEKKRKQKVRSLNVGDEAEAKRRGKVRYYVINEICRKNVDYHISIVRPDNILRKSDKADGIYQDFIIVP